LNARFSLQNSKATGGGWEEILAPPHLSSTFPGLFPSKLLSVHNIAVEAGTFLFFSTFPYEKVEKSSGKVNIHFSDAL
jgi:hypothetical protein